MISMDELREFSYRAAADLDERNGTDRAEIAARVMKVGEEAGEVFQAWIGWTGQNPRKGVTHTKADVALELADVILAATVALASLDMAPDVVLAERLARVNARWEAAVRPLREIEARQVTADLIGAKTFGVTA
jgi:phosphoribosyl-ATP pyrophosphohydrolase